MEEFGRWRSGERASAYWEERVKRGVRESENKKLIQLFSPFQSKPEMYHSSPWMLFFSERKGRIIK